LVSLSISGAYLKQIKSHKREVEGRAFIFIPLHTVKKPEELLSMIECSNAMLPCQHHDENQRSERQPLHLKSFHILDQRPECRKQEEESPPPEQQIAQRKGKEEYHRPMFSAKNSDSQTPPSPDQK
jgi:hypothetical protein